MLSEENFECFESSIMELIENQNYLEAINLFETIKHIKSPQLIVAEATCYYNLKKYMNSIEILKHAEELGWNLFEIYLLKGRSLYKIQEWELALKAFEFADELKTSYVIKQWITRCKAHITIEQDPESDHIIQFEPPVISDVRREWYQHGQTIVIVLYVRDVSEHELKVNYQPKKVSLTISQNKPISLQLKLSKEIIPEQSSYYITPSKIELKMRKATNVQWSNVEEE